MLAKLSRSESEVFMKPRRILFAFTMLLFALQAAWPKQSRPSRSPSVDNKPVHVRGYKTKKGKRVRPYNRRYASHYRHRSWVGHERLYYGRHPERDPEQREEFERMTGYPNGMAGYVVDHVVPLACGGVDEPSNMQWQTVEEARAKDKWERNGCKK